MEVVLTIAVILFMTGLIVCLISLLYGLAYGIMHNDSSMSNILFKISIADMVVGIILFLTVVL